MKAIRVLAFSLLLASSMSVFAATKNSASVTFSEPVTVEGVRLAAGDYRMQWDGSGPLVQVNFLKGKQTLATVPATLVEQNNANALAVETDNADPSVTVVQKIDLKHESFIFTAGGQTPTSPNSSLDSGEEGFESAM